MRKLNVVFAAGRLLLLGVLGGAIFWLHGFQVRRHTTAFLRIAQQAEARGELMTTSNLLVMYLHFRPRDPQPMAWYARIRDEITPIQGRRNQVHEIFEEASRLNPGDRELER